MIGYIAIQDTREYFCMSFSVLRGIANQYVVDTGRGEIGDACW